MQAAGQAPPSSLLGRVLGLQIEWNQAYPLSLSLPTAAASRRTESHRLRKPAWGGSGVGWQPVRPLSCLKWMLLLRLLQLHSRSENLRTDQGPPLGKVTGPPQPHPGPSPGPAALDHSGAHLLLLLPQFTPHWSLTKITLSSSPGQRRGKAQTMLRTAPQVERGWGPDMWPLRT